MDAQEFRSLQEAYMEVVENQQLNELSVNKMLAYKKKAEKNRDELNKKWDKGTATYREKMRVLGREEGEARASRRIEKKTGKHPLDMNKLDKLKASVKKEEVDTYDIILSHLLDEGYAETPEAAEAIMVNMSEEWREDIMEGYKRYPAKKVGNKLDRMYDDPDTDTRFGKTGKRYSQMRTVDSHMKGEVHPLIRAHSPKKSKAKETENRKRGENG